jgi:hypothetical protein
LNDGAVSCNRELWEKKKCRKDNLQSTFRGNGKEAGGGKKRMSRLFFTNWWVFGN